MSVQELLRATTTDRQDYEPLFLQIALADLGRRWHQVREMKEIVHIRLNDQDDEMVTPEQALGRLDQEFQSWDAWVFTNCLEDVLLLQKERTGWLGHYLRDGDYVTSFHMKGLEEARRTARSFLELENVDQLFEDTCDITQMIVLTQTDSQHMVEAVAEELGERGIPVLVQTRASTGLFHSESVSYRGSGYIILVDTEYALEAQKALERIDKLIETLHEEAELCSERGETDKEIEIYKRVLKLAPADEVALFNQGIALLETERYSEAADCFVHAALLADDETAPRLEECLGELAAKVPKNTDVLNALADLARRRGDLDQVKTYLTAILAVQPDDSLAHVSLGHLYFEESTHDTKALFHFREYLRLSADAEDREMIEGIVRELEQE